MNKTVKITYHINSLLSILDTLKNSSWKSLVVMHIEKAQEFSRNIEKNDINHSVMIDSGMSPSSSESIRVNEISD